MELYCTPKVNTLQLNIASNSSNTRTPPTRTVSEHSVLKNSSNRASCGNLPTLTSILTVRRLLNTRRDNPSSGYRSTCTPQQHLGIYIINPPFTSSNGRMSSPSTVALRFTSNLYSFSDPTHNFIRSPLSSHRHFHSNISVYIVAWKRLFSLLRYRGNSTMPHRPVVAQQEAEVMLPRKPNMWHYLRVFMLISSSSDSK
jgi:hypothetical protein